MDRKKIKEKIESVTNIKVMFDISMSKYTSMRIGGDASMFLKVDNIENLKKILKIVKEDNIPIYILGNGTNTIVKDGGLNKLVIKLGFDEVKINKEDEDGNIFVEVGSAVQLKGLIYNLASLGIGPVSNLYGIPATIGGAIKMNAGAYNVEMKDIVYQTTYMDYNGNCYTLTLDEHKFGYRDSFFQHNDVIIIKSILKFKKVDKKVELENVLNIMQKRVEKQPLEYPNTGSIFKRGQNFYASKEIDDANLRGRQIGGIAVSEKHAGFLINKGNGTYKDFKNLVSIIQDEVFKNSGNKLELEVIIIGEE